MRIAIPEFSMVALIGASGSGKSTFARKHFLPTQVLSSDTFRGYVCDDEESQEHSAEAFDALYYMLAKRLEIGRLTVVDATNVQQEHRKRLIRIANEWHALRVAIVFDTPESVCHERNAQRPNRQFGRHVVRNQRMDLRRTIRQLKAERWHKVYFIRPEDSDDIEVFTERLWSRRPDLTGPFDIIGDVHGCLVELKALLEKLGWTLEPEPTHPDGRMIVFVGDLVDRGPDPVGVLKFVMSAVKAGRALCVPGNHDIRLVKALRGAKVGLGHGLRETLEAVQSETPEFCAEVADFLEALVSHLVLDNGNLCVAHAGLPTSMQGRGSAVVRKFCLYGETTGEVDEFGLPIRYEWARNYRGRALVVHGHVPVISPQWVNNTIDIDTGCCFGGSLTALRYPEKEIVSVPARATYVEPIRPPSIEVEPTRSDELLDIQDVLGRRSIETELAGRVTIREENAIAALEVMSRFACDPRWLIYLPPTMSPCATSRREGCLEYPEEAFQYYEECEIEEVICEEKHMGSRAVAVVCRSPDTARRRFGVETGEMGVITTRTGRRFFEDIEWERQIVGRIVRAADTAGIFEHLESDWMLLDMELMPWSAKAVGLLRDQYAPVGAAAENFSHALSRVADKLKSRSIEGSDEIVALAERRSESARRFRDAYRRYCWPVNLIEDLKLAPFHLMASEGKVHIDKDHRWHVAACERLCEADPNLFQKTKNRTVLLADPEQRREACEWWESLVSSGGEGIVVKPMNFVARHKGRLIQPAVKCRGPEYLRIIYGPEYLEPENLTRLRQRGLTRKRGLAIREFALGIEALRRFVENAHPSQVHECVFGVLALESEPVDPRL